MTQSSFLKRALPAGLIVLAILLAYDPLMSSPQQFLDWDDGDNIVGNKGIQGLDLQHLRWMFTANVLGVYEPVAWLAKALEFAAFGLDPLAFKLMTLSLHCVNALLFLLISRRVIRIARPGLAPDLLTIASVLAALLFALHPLRVEVVAWASGQPYALAGSFYLLSVHGYLKHREKGSRLSPWLVLSVAAYLLAALSKTASVMLPLTLLALDYYPLGGFEPRRSILGKVPYLLVAGAFVVVARQATEGAQPAGSVDLDFLQRVARAAHALVFYLVETVWPADLSPHYPVPLEGVSLFAPGYFLDLLLVVGLTAWAVRSRARRPWILAAWGSYVAVLLPVLGFVQHGHPVLAADRYTYLASFGWCLLAASAAVGPAFEKWPVSLRRSIGGGVLALLMLLTALQARPWRNTETLWKHALVVDPADALAYNNLGFHLMAQPGREPEAARFLECAVALDPGDTKSVLNYGVVLERLERLPEAAALYQREIERAPDEPLLHFNLGNVLSRMGLADPAREQYERALAISPSLDAARQNLARLTAR